MTRRRLDLFILFLSVIVLVGTAGYFKQSSLLFFNLSILGLIIAAIRLF